MSKATHNGSLVLLCVKEKKWGKMDEGFCSKTLSEQNDQYKTGGRQTEKEKGQQRLR